jgi:hypothetical protein
MGFGRLLVHVVPSREGRPDGEVGRPWKERLVREGRAHAALVFDGEAAVAWCQYGSPEELPRIYHRKEWEAGLTGEPPAYRITCIFVTGTIGRKASQPWRFVEPSTGSRRRAERVKRIGYVGLRTDDVQAMTSFFRSG